MTVEIIGVCSGVKSPDLRFHGYSTRCWPSRNTCRPRTAPETTRQHSWDTSHRPLSPLSAKTFHVVEILQNIFIRQEDCQKWYRTLKWSHTTAYGISVRSQTLIYVRTTLGILRVRSEYADIRRRTLCYTQRPNYFLDMFKMYQRMQAYRIYVTNTLTICITYAGYARHTLNTLKVRYLYVMNKLLIRL